MQRIKLNSHEMMELARGLIGRSARILSSPDRTQIGIEGEIIDETLKTIVMLTKNGKKVIQKKGIVLEIGGPDGKIIVSGNVLIQRPEERIKKWWKKIRKVKRHDSKSKRSGM